jgi:hypothetical protein
MILNIQFIFVYFKQTTCFDLHKGSKHAVCLKYTNINCIFNIVVFDGYSSSYLIHTQRGWRHLKFMLETVFLVGCTFD